MQGKQGKKSKARKGSNASMGRNGNKASKPRAASEASKASKAGNASNATKPARRGAQAWNHPGKPSNQRQPGKRSKEGKIGKEHFMQALILYFIKKHSKMSKYAPTFMKKLVDEDVLSEKFLLKWFDKKVKLDKDSLLYDKKAEKKYKELIE